MRITEDKLRKFIRNQLKEFQSTSTGFGADIEPGEDSPETDIAQDSYDAWVENEPTYQVSTMGKDGKWQNQTYSAIWRSKKTNKLGRYDYSHAKSRPAGYEANPEYTNWLSKKDALTSKIDTEKEMDVERGKSDTPPAVGMHARGKGMKLGALAQAAQAKMAKLSGMKKAGDNNKKRKFGTGKSHLPGNVKR